LIDKSSLVVAHKSKKNVMNTTQIKSIFDIPKTFETDCVNLSLDTKNKETGTFY